jgi:epoxyqueuosine reductase
VLALPYLPATKESRKVMGLFACHDNYGLATAMAKELRKKLAPVFGVSAKSIAIACNSQRLNEKKLAYDAGIGVYGKNSLIMVHGFGSFVVLLALQLPVYWEQWAAKHELAKLCKECNLCQRSCPSQALHRAYHLDRTLCLQSMASVGMLPIAPVLPVIYGCDICQNVCPYNKEALTFYKEQALGAKFEPWCDVGLWQQGNVADIQKAIRYSPLRFSWLNKEALVLNARMRLWYQRLCQGNREKKSDEELI